MNEEEKKALRVINTRTRRLLDELEIEKENMSDELRIAYLMQEIRANKTILNLIEKLQKENEELNKENENLNREINRRIKLKIENEKIVDTQFIYKQKIKDKIIRNEKIIDISNDGELIHELYQQNKVYEELLKEGE